MGFGSTDFCPDLSCQWDLDLNVVLAGELQMLNEKCKPLAQIQSCGDFVPFASSEKRQTLKLCSKIMSNTFLNFILINKSLTLLGSQHDFLCGHSGSWSCHLCLDLLKDKASIYQNQNAPTSWWPLRHPTVLQHYGEPLKVHNDLLPPLHRVSAWGVECALETGGSSPDQTGLT